MMLLFCILTAAAQEEDEAEATVEAEQVYVDDQAQQSLNELADLLETLHYVEPAEAAAEEEPENDDIPEAEEAPAEEDAGPEIYENPAPQDTLVETPEEQPAEE